MKISEKEVKKIMNTHMEEWLDFLDSWRSEFLSTPVSTSELLDIFKSSDFYKCFSVSSPKESVSILNKLLWRQKDREFFGYFIRLAPITETSYPRKYYLDSSGVLV